MHAMQFVITHLIKTTRKAGERVHKIPFIFMVKNVILKTR